MGIISEFREFALKGNVIDLAVGVIIGAAFGGVTKSVVDDVIMPVIARLVGHPDFSNLYMSLSPDVDRANAAFAATQPSDATVLHVIHIGQRLPLAKAREIGAVLAYGNFITVVINFLIVAFCVFIVVKVMNTAKRRFEKQQAAGAAPLDPQVQVLTEIRDLLKTK